MNTSFGSSLFTVDAIDPAGDADLRREIVLRMWAMMYGTLWNAGV
jgi:hypothetical protein